MSKFDALLKTAEAESAPTEADKIAEEALAVGQLQGRGILHALKEGGFFDAVDKVASAAEQFTKKAEGGPETPKAAPEKPEVNEPKNALDRLVDAGVGGEGTPQPKGGTNPDSVKPEDQAPVDQHGEKAPGEKAASEVEPVKKASDVIIRYVKKENEEGTV